MVEEGEKVFFRHLIEAVYNKFTHSAENTDQRPAGSSFPAMPAVIIQSVLYLGDDIFSVSFVQKRSINTHVVSPRSR